MTSTLPQLPFDQTDPFEVPAELRQLQARDRITRVRTAPGDEAWLILRHRDVKALLMDNRVGKVYPGDGPPPRIFDSPLLERTQDRDRETQEQQHKAMRALLTPAFSVKRMRAQRAYVEELTDQLLDDMRSGGNSADLHTALSFPLPALVISSLLGVPPEDREDFGRWSAQVGDTSDRANAQDGLDRLHAYMTGLLDRKRAEPAEDVLSDLVAAQKVVPHLTDEAAARMGAGLLFAGHETTSVRIDLGAILLIQNPSQRRAMLADPALVPATVEEILRVATPTTITGLVQYAQEDFAFGGELIRTGDAIMFGGGNFDDEVFADPYRFDATRQPNPHLTFSFGTHFCIGNQLARIELQVVLTKLFERFPDLTLAVPLESLELRRDQLGGGIHSLPVTW